jgi:hypothetical protein
MDRVQAAGFAGIDRPLLSQMAIATVLVGSAAALSSAGIAVPVSKVGFSGGWNDEAPTAPRKAVAERVLPMPALSRISAPEIAATPTIREIVPLPRTTVAIVDRAAVVAKASPAQGEPAPQPHLTVSEVAKAVSAPSLVELPAAPPAPMSESSLVTAPPTPARLAAPASLAASAAAPLPEVAAPAAQAKPALPAEPPVRLINPPELRGFDLGRVSVAPRLAKPAGKPAAASKVEILGKKDRIVGDALFHQVAVSVAGSERKTIDVRIGADMKPSIKVGDLLALVSDRMDPDSAARFAAASSAGEFVSLATLRDAGFDVSYSAGTDSISISAAQ